MEQDVRSLITALINSCTGAAALIDTPDSEADARLATFNAQSAGLNSAAALVRRDLSQLS
jgi:hypothetical protein